MSPISAQQPPPRRPRALTPPELHFYPSPPVGWLSPQLLTATAVRVTGAQFFGAYMDKRELQGALPAHVYDHSADSDDDGDFWLDYIADLGDSFDATYSMAYLAAQPELEVRGADGDESVRLPRGRVTVLGGDEVYPTPGWRAYENRFRGPYRAALPVPPERPATMYALPGNHDWYDGLTAFLRVFAKEGWIGGWRTQQTRSYFALQLPRRWWLFALDTQLSNSYIDTPQLRYFEEAASRLRPGDRVLVCLAEPAWVNLADATDAYDPTDFFLRRVIRESGATVHVLLAGDLHHYSRYELVGGDPESAAAEPVVEPEAPDTEHADNQPPPVPERPDDVLVAEAAAAPVEEPVELVERLTDKLPAPPPQTPLQMITCGGGGAFLAGTARLPERIQAPSPYTMARHAGPPHDYRLAERYPSKQASERYSFGVFHRLPLRNPGFNFAIGVIHTLLLFAFLTSQYQLITFPSLTMSAFVVASTVALAGGQRIWHRVAGAIHGIAHIGLGILGTLIWVRLPVHTWWTPWEVLVAAAVYGPIIGLVGSQVVAAYLLIAGRFSINTNELFASQGIKDAKCFLRFRIDSDGELTIYPIALDKVCRSWRAAPDDAPERPWIAPEDPLRPRLIEPPIHVTQGHAHDREADRTT